MKILLVEPNYYTQYPPLGLLKLSSLYKAQGHEVRFVRGLSLVTRFVPDEVKVTSLFTWAWKPVWEAVAFYRALFPKAKVSLGGIYASLTPEHAKLSGADEVVTGLISEAEDLLPDYSIVPEWHTQSAASILFSYRGCVRSCGFCAVPKLEGRPFKTRPTTHIKHLVHPDHKRVILWDNNILGESHWLDVVGELTELGVEADFNQGLDARFVTEAVATSLTGLKIPTIRFAYDFISMRDKVKRAITLLRGAGMTNRRVRRISCYVLYNYKDTPEDLFERVRDLLAWGVAAYPMRYQPLNGEYAFEKDSYISPSWSQEELEMVSAARRVIGFGGAFPPYEGLLKKFCDAKGFHDAFELRQKKHSSKSDALPVRRPRSVNDGFELKEFAWDLLNMGKDHQFPVHNLMDQNSKT
ncbi:MAG: radical SAM protein [Pyrinomonadaceae bacterium]